jgi:hypothetical protein
VIAFFDASAPIYLVAWLACTGRLALGVLPPAWWSPSLFFGDSASKKVSGLNEGY